jgi:hypothetical protein
MRLSDWRAAAPHRDAVGPKVVAATDPVLRALGADADPDAWVAWGEEPQTRYAILVPTDPGLISCFVRVLVPGEGPRISAKLIRWNRVAIGELAVESQQGHRLLSFQLEQQVLRGVDDEADRVAAFALRVIAAIDGRPLPAVMEPARRGGARAAGSPATTRARARSGSPSGKTPATKTPSTSAGGQKAAKAPAGSRAVAPARARR